MYKYTAVTVLLLVATTANAQTENPRWITPPPAEATEYLMPGFARNASINGRVALLCDVAAPGPPDSCEIEEVSPEGLGFEAAALAVARTGILRPGRQYGAYIPSTIRFVVRFSAEDAKTPTVTYDGSTPSSASLEMARIIVREGADMIRPTSLYEMLDGLATERQAIVIEWIDELALINVDRIIDQQALAMARIFTEAEMQAYLANGTVPENPFPDDDTLQAATIDFKMPGYEQGLDKLRSRYCARWSCEIVTK